MKPEPEQGSRVVRCDVRDEMLDLAIDADYDSGPVAAKVRVGWHGA
jgi:hypothetical protein